MIGHSPSDQFNLEAQNKRIGAKAMQKQQHHGLGDSEVSLSIKVRLLGGGGLKTGSNNSALSLRNANDFGVGMKLLAGQPQSTLLHCKCRRSLPSTSILALLRRAFRSSMIRSLRMSQCNDMMTSHVSMNSQKLCCFCLLEDEREI